MNRVVHFEIHAQNPEKAGKFYSDIFGWEIKEWKLPAEIQIPDENRYWMVMTGKTDEPGGINGGILFRKGPAPEASQAVNAFVCTINVPSVSEYLKKITDAGGTVALPTMAIPNVGWLAYCKDLDGNLFGIMEDDKEAK